MNSQAFVSVMAPSKKEASMNDEVTAKPKSFLPAEQLSGECVKERDQMTEKETQSVMAPATASKEEAPTMNISNDVVSSERTKTSILLEQQQLPPRECVFDMFELYKWEGFWYRPRFLEAALRMQSDFKSRNDDVILASSMKTGTTWMKALLTCMLLNKDGEEDLLSLNHPAFYVQTLEVQVYTSSPVPDLSGIPSPRVFHTHLPYHALPQSMKDSDTKIVYITRNPKDTLVSMWHFFNTFRSQEQGPYPFEETFEKFCAGVCHFGPFFDHVLGYWKESLKMPNKILFLKYEDLKKDPRGELKRLALFLGKPFSNEKDVDDVLKKCALERLKNLEVNKKGMDPWVKMPNSASFRLGVIGDWKNKFTPEMAARLDRVTTEKFEGSGIDFQCDDN